MATKKAEKKVVDEHDVLDEILQAAIGWEQNESEAPRLREAVQVYLKNRHTF